VLTYSTNTDLILKGLTWNFCLVYIDDIIVYSPSFEQHIDVHVTLELADKPEFEPFVREMLDKHKRFHIPCELYDVCKVLYFSKLLIFVVEYYRFLFSNAVQQNKVYIEIISAYVM